ncbi:helix-turn-helix domain-containing protein [Bacteroides sp. 224]|uniref:helix-turn-helix domain-containing protein n=1 Tax=Bacteroides sp. 224 TaxID=2302936 RepID=UPI0013D6D499|nr:helix-turn-helix transcriptional regulator [Bacteroides sp. 224]NDV66325.1 XRE family transcriptional regulator [Bacteroides sp. 224]
MNKTGKNIKKIRNVKGLSQQAFADLFQLSRGNISSYEELRAEPKIEVLLKIANYFGIPVADLIEKDLSVNELLHYNTQLVVETEKLKITQQLVKVPYIPALYINDYICQYKNEEFFHKLPHLIVPSNSKFRLIAIEVDNRENLPAEFNYQNGDILIYEQVIKENIHRITHKLGILVNNEGIKMGIYKEKENHITLALNNWIEYPFEIESQENQYWVLKACYSQS